MTDRQQSERRFALGESNRPSGERAEDSGGRLQALGIDNPFGRHLSPRDFETFVQSLLSELVLANLGAGIFRGKTYRSALTGRDIEADVSIEFSVAGVAYISLIECKFQKRKVEVSVVRDLKQRLDEIGAHKGIIISTSWFQRGAIELAKATGIALIQVEESSAPQLTTRMAALQVTSGAQPTHWGVRKVVAPELEGTILIPALCRLATCIRRLLEALEE